MISLNNLEAKMKREVDCEKAWKIVKRMTNRAIKNNPYASIRCSDLLDYMTEARKQCTKPQKKEG